MLQRKPTFIKFFRISLFVLLLSQTTCTSKKTSSAAADDAMPVDVIDVHTHPRFTGKPERTSGIVVTREQYVKEMKDAGVIAAVALEGSDGVGYDSDLESLNVIRCAGVGEKVDVARIEKGLKSGFYKCLKIYLGYIPQYAYSPAYEPAYKLAEKYQVPVVFHTGDTYDSDGLLKYADPLTIDEVAVKHRKITFVIAHCGNPWIQSAAEVAYKNANVYLDGSAFMIDDINSKPKESVEKLVVEPLSWIFLYVEDPTKLMYGTDWPLVHMKDYLNAFKRAIPKQYWKDVFHDNAVRVFKLKIPLTKADAAVAKP